MGSGDKARKKAAFTRGGRGFQTSCFFEVPTQTSRTVGSQEKRHMSHPIRLFIVEAKS